MEEWRALPWWQAQLYWEGLQAEVRAMSQEQEEPEVPLSDLAGLGLRVRQVS